MPIKRNNKNVIPFISVHSGGKIVTLFYEMRCSSFVPFGNLPTIDYQRMYQEELQRLTTIWGPLMKIEGRELENFDS